MGCVHGRTSRGIHFLIAALAVLGFELDVMSNPFSAELILSQLPGLLSPGESEPIATWGDQAKVHGHLAVAARSGAIGTGAETRPARSLNVKLTVDEAVAARLRNYAPLRLLGHVLCLVLPPLTALPGGETYSPPLSLPHSDVLTRLCRFRC